MIRKVKRGEIYLVNISSSLGSVQNGVRPVLVIQNNKGNKYSPTVIVACLSSQIDHKAHLPTHYILPEGLGLKFRTMVLCEQIRSVDKQCFIKYIGKVPKRWMTIIDKKVMISLGIEKKVLNNASRSNIV